jgi:hypothetical protein
MTLVLTDGNSRFPAQTAASAQAVRDAGIAIAAVGIGYGIEYTELVSIAGDESRVYNVSNFDDLGSIVESITKTTCFGEYMTT